MSIDSSDRSENLPPHLSVVIPAYNEAERIGGTMERMLAYFDSQALDVEILVVDDGSSDATQDVVRTAIGAHTNVRILHYDGNRGKGFAVRYGMVRAAGEYVLFSDADESTPIREVEKLYAAIRDGQDVAIGSRDVAGSKLTRHQSRLREAGGKLFNRFVQMLAVPGIHDTQCGFKLFTRAAAQNIFNRCQIDNFSFDVESLYIARLLGYSIGEVGVEWHHCEGSKVDYLRDSLRMLGTLFRIRATDYQVNRAGMGRPLSLDK